ncbi:hypothetical protein D3C86_1562670 [compost metagenome]
MKTLVRSCNIPVGILINREETVSTERILIPFFSISDSFLLIYAQKLIQNNKSVVVIVDVLGTIAQNPELKESIRMIEQVAPNHIALYGGNTVTEAQRNNNDMMMISIESLKRAVTTHSTWLSSLPSILVMKP